MKPCPLTAMEAKYTRIIGQRQLALCRWNNSMALYRHTVAIFLLEDANFDPAGGFPGAPGGPWNMHYFGLDRPLVFSSKALTFLFW